MKIVGIIFWIIGSLLLLTGFASSGVPNYGNTLNFGLLIDKVIYVMIGMTFFIAGSVFLSAHSIRSILENIGQASGVPAKKNEPEKLIKTLSDSSEPYEYQRALIDVGYKVKYGLDGWRVREPLGGQVKLDTPEEFKTYARAALAEHEVLQN
jgi:hypothetical protein